MRPSAPWAILEVELGKPLEPLDCPPEANAALLILRYEGAVLGRLVQPRSAFPLSVPMLRTLAARATGDAAAMLVTTQARPLPVPRVQQTYLEATIARDDARLAELSALLDERRSRPIAVTASIVICTAGRAEDLAACLTSIRAEIEGGREVVVVDNGPDDATEAAVRRFPGVRYVVERRRGLSRARNAGILAARSDVVVFVDDDVRPEPGWIDPLLRAFEADDIDVVCGLVLPAALETDAQIAFEYDLGFGGMGHWPLLFDASFIAAHRNLGVPVWTIGAGANMAVRRRRVLELGGFDERIGPGAAGGCGDDSEYWHRVLFAGGRAVYEPLSVVRHWHRRDWASLRRQAYGYAFGSMVALFAEFARNRHRGDLRHAFLSIPFWLLKRTLAAPLRRAWGQPDELIGAWLRGYAASLRHVSLMLQVPPPPPEIADAAGDRNA